MAIIVYDPGVDVIKGHRKGLQFDISTGGYIVKKKSRPVNRQTNLRMKYRLLLKQVNQAYWDLNAGQKTLWTNFAIAAGIRGPWGMGNQQQGCAGYFSCALNALFAGDGLPLTPGPPVPIAGVTFTALVRIDKDTVRATFNPTPAGANHRIYLRQSLPGPGHRNWKHFDGYIAEYSAKNPNSTFDFNTKFQHLTGWNGRYWLGTQDTFGGRSVETEWDL